MQGGVQSGVQSGILELDDKGLDEVVELWNILHRAKDLASTLTYRLYPHSRT